MSRTVILKKSYKLILSKSSYSTHAWFNFIDLVYYISLRSYYIVNLLC